MASCKGSSRAVHGFTKGAAAEATIEINKMYNAPRTKFLLADTVLKADDNTFAQGRLGAVLRENGTKHQKTGTAARFENFSRGRSSM